MVDVPERTGARGVGRRRLLSVVRRFAGFGICRARGVAAWRRTCPAGDPGTHAFARSATGASPARGLVLGRQPPAAFRIVAGLDGAIARARGQCRCRHHGGKLQPDIYHLARRTVGGGRLHQCVQRHAGGRDQGVAARAFRSRGDTAGRPSRLANGRRADRSSRPARSRRLSRSLATARINCKRLDSPASGRHRPHQRTTSPALEACDRRSRRRAGARGKLDARGGRHLRRLRQSERADCR